MAYADFSLADAYNSIITKLNSYFTAAGKLFKNQTTGDYTDQIRYNSNTKRLEYWSGSAWAALDVSATEISNATNAGRLNSQLASYYATATGLVSVSDVANAALPSASYTAADVLTKLLTVDGAGSGTDADLLDGQQGAYYLACANFTGTLPVARFPSGSVISRYHANNTTPQTISDTISADGTPSVAEGAQIFAAAIAANSATSTIRLSGVINAVKSNNNTAVVVAIFRDTTCIGATVSPLAYYGQAFGWAIPYMIIDTPGDTSSHTYSVRVGVIGSDSGSVYLNYKGTYNFGDNNAVSSLSIIEILP